MHHSSIEVSPLGFYAYSLLIIKTQTHLSLSTFRFLSNECTFHMETVSPFRLQPGALCQCMLGNQRICLCRIRYQGLGRHAAGELQTRYWTWASSIECISIPIALLQLCLPPWSLCTLACETRGSHSFDSPPSNKWRIYSCCRSKAKSTAYSFHTRSTPDDRSDPPLHGCNQVFE